MSVPTANKPLLSLILCIGACIGMIASAPAAAKKSDRSEPMDIDAGRQQGSLDDRGPTVLSGGVTIRQGTLDIRSDRAEISLAKDGEPQRALLTGSPVTLKQEMNDGTPMSARANTVDYDLQGEIVVFTGNVSIQQPRGTMTGERVVYDLNSGEVNSGGEGAGRVQMRIQPKSGQGQRGAAKDGR